MEVIGISSKLTVNENEVTFVLDEEMPDEVLAKISYGSLSFNADGRFLTVSKDPDDEAFSPRMIATLNEKIAEAVQSVSRDSSQRDRMLQQIAAETRLPLL